jgi:iron complex transport system substrate-binding protein
MRAFAFASAISLALAGAAEAAPRRVASLNLCTDELLLALGAGQIVSVTHLAQQPAETSLWRQARRYRSNDGSLVSVAGLRPDLVLTMGGGARDRVRIAQRLGIRILDLPYPQSLADIEASGPHGGGGARARGRRQRLAGADRAAEAQPPRRRGPTRSGSAAAAARCRLRGLRRSGWRWPACASGHGRRPGVARAIADPAAGRPAAQRLSKRPIFGRAALARPSAGAARARRPDDRHRRPAWTCMGPR